VIVSLLIKGLLCWTLDWLGANCFYVHFTLVVVSSHFVYTLKVSLFMSMVTSHYHAGSDVLLGFSMCSLSWSGCSFLVKSLECGPKGRVGVFCAAVVKVVEDCGQK